MLRDVPNYRVRRSSRARNVNLTISPDKGLVVVVPHGFDERLIPGLVHKQSTWIEKRLAKLGYVPGTDPGWRRPEHIDLKAVDEDWIPEYCATPSLRVRITASSDGSLRVTGACDNSVELRAAFRRWLKRRAEAVLPARLTELAEHYGFSFARVTIRHQRSRWGSCSTRGTISLNARLMLLSSELVDHVLLHELCHTVHPHHGESFWSAFADLAPNHRHQRAALRDAWATIPNWAVR